MVLCCSGDLGNFHEATDLCHIVWSPSIGEKMLSSHPVGEIWSVSFCRATSSVFWDIKMRCFFFFSANSLLKTLGCAPCVYNNVQNIATSPN